MKNLTFLFSFLNFDRFNYCLNCHEYHKISVLHFGKKEVLEFWAISWMWNENIWFVTHCRGHGDWTKPWIWAKMSFVIVCNFIYYPIFYKHELRGINIWLRHCQKLLRVLLRNSGRGRTVVAGILGKAYKFISHTNDANGFQQHMTALWECIDSGLK